MKTKIGLVWGASAALCVGLLGCGAGDFGGEAEIEAADEAALLDRHNPSLVLAPLPAQPSLNDVFIESISTGGPGCPDSSTVTTEIAPDRKSFIVIFDRMILSFPPGPPIKQLNCIANVKLHVPQGWQYSVATVNTRGYVFLENPGHRAQQSSSYFFAGTPLGTSWHSTFNGPKDEYYTFTDNVGITSLVWSECGTSAMFDVNTRLNLNVIGNPTGNAYFNAENIDGKFKKVFHIQWRQC